MDPVTTTETVFIKNVSGMAEMKFVVTVEPAYRYGRALRGATDPNITALKRKDGMKTTKFKKRKILKFV